MVHSKKLIFHEHYELMHCWQYETYNGYSTCSEICNVSFLSDYNIEIYRNCFINYTLEIRMIPIDKKNIQKLYSVCKNL